MRNHAHARAIDSTRTRGGFICKGVVNGGSEYGEGCAFAASFLLRSVSVALLLSLSPSFACAQLRYGHPLLLSPTLNIALLSRRTAVLVSREQYFHPSSISRSRSSRIKFDVSVARAPARALPLFAYAPSDHSLAFSLSLPLLLSLSPSLNLYTHKDGHDDVTKHVTIV